jgi:hypothetical protein
VFVGLVWGGLAVALLYYSIYYMLDAIRVKEIPSIDDKRLRPHLTKEERQEYLRLERSRSAGLAVALLATGIEVAVNAWFSLGFFEQQVGGCTRLLAFMHSLILTHTPPPPPRPSPSLSPLHSGWSKRWPGQRNTPILAKAGC